MKQARKIIPVDVIALVEDQATMHPIVILRDPQANILLPIWIGEPEARAIALALDNVVTSRPLTHRLLLSVFDALGGKISRVVIDSLKEHTYFATIHLRTKSGIVLVDARPSDALALAVEAKIPIFVSKEVMDKGGQTNPFSAESMSRPQRKPVDVKKELSTIDTEKLKEMMEKARKLEQKSSGNGK